MNLCVISARGGSKGLPNKNIKKMLGKPLIAWSIEQALSVKEIDKVIVSTDSKKIAKISNKYGAETPFLRPRNISKSNSAKFEVFKYSLLKCEKFYKTKFNYYLDLDCTNPLRSVLDIKKIIKFFNSNKDNIDGVFTICEARKNPYFNLVEKNKDETLKLSKKLSRPITRRQDSPKVYEHVASMYVLKPDFIKRKKNLMDGRILGFNVPQEKSLDIDSSYDFSLVEYLLKKRK